MRDQHPDIVTLRRFHADRLKPAQSQEVGRHLTHCEPCRLRSAGLRAGLMNERDGGGEGPDPVIGGLLSRPDAANKPAASSYEDILSRTFESLLEREEELEQDRLSASDLIAQIEDHPPKRARALIASSRRFKSWGLVELLLLRASEEWFERPERAEHLADLALRAAERLGPPEHSARLVFDLQARCHTYLGNARRVRAKLRQAEASFTRAEDCIARGTSDPLEKAHFLRFKASLCRDQRRLDEAERVLREAFGIYCRVGAQVEAGRTLINLATVHRAQGEPEKAIRVLEDAGRRIDVHREPELALIARHNLIDYLAESDRHMEARAQLAASRELYEKHARAGLRRRWLWVKGKVAAGLGQSELAEKAYRAVRDEYRESELIYDYALVSMDLTVLLVGEGRNAEVMSLAEEMIHLFQALEIHRETLAVLLLFREAARSEQITRSLVRELADRIRRRRWPPARHGGS